MKSENFVASFDMVSLEDNEFNALKNFFEGYNGIKFGYNIVGCATNINVSRMQLVCSENNKKAKILIGGFLIIFKDEDSNPDWEWLEKMAPGISEIKDEWNCEEVWDLWDRYGELWEMLEEDEDW